MSINKILRPKQTKEVVGYSVPSLYRLEKEGLFPKRIKLGQNASGWLESEVNEWLENKIAERDLEVA